MIPELQDLALQQYLELVKKLAFLSEHEIRREVSKKTVEKIFSNFGKVKGLAAVVVAALYSHSKTQSWETTRKVLQKSLHHFEVLIQKNCCLETVIGPLKENSSMLKETIDYKEIKLVIKNDNSGTYLDIYPKNNEYKNFVDVFMFKMFTEENETFDAAEKLFMSLSLSNIKEACVNVHLHAKKILNNCDASRTFSLKSEMLRTIVELESRNKIKPIQEVHMTVKKYLETGPYKTWKEVQSEFIKYLIQQPLLHVYANQLSEFLFRLLEQKAPRFTSPEGQKMMIEACLHPAITKLNACQIPADILLELLPKFKHLVTLDVKVSITESQALNTKDAKVFSYITQYCSKLKSLRITLRPSVVFSSEESEILLEDLLAALPTMLTSICFSSVNGVLKATCLDKMAISEKFSLLNRLTLINTGCNYPLHGSFKHLISVELVQMGFIGNELFMNVGAWLKEINLTCVTNIDITELAKSCLSLETLILKACTFSSFHTKPLPVFNSLKELVYTMGLVCLSMKRKTTYICIWCILKNSPKIEKVVTVLSKPTVNGGITCLGEKVSERLHKYLIRKDCSNELIKINQLIYLQEFQLYQHGNRTLEGLITKNLALRMINVFPALSFIGGIEDMVAQNSLREIYPNKTFVCLCEKTKQKVLEAHRFELHMFFGSVLYNEYLNSSNVDHECCFGYFSGGSDDE